MTRSRCLATPRRRLWLWGGEYDFVCVHDYRDRVLLGILLNGGVPMRLDWVQPRTDFCDQMEQWGWLMDLEDEQEVNAEAPMCGAP